VLLVQPGRQAGGSVAKRAPVTATVEKRADTLDAMLDLVKLCFREK
jgi:hypothetical protein